MQSNPIQNLSIIIPHQQVLYLAQWFLTFFTFLPPFIKQDYQIYTQYTHCGAPFLKIWN